MRGLRRLFVYLLVAAAVTASACSPDTPTAPTPADGSLSASPSGSGTPPSTSDPPAQPQPPSPTPPPSDPNPPSDSGAPVITTQPKSRTIDAGKDATLTVAATGDGTLKYQWYTGSTGQTVSPIANAKSDAFTTPALTKTTKYWVRVSNAKGSTDSETATITVKASEPDEPAATAPVITSQPKDKTIASGQSAALSVSASGTGPLTYRWYQGASGNTSSPVNGATSASYTTPPLTATTRYWVRVSNGVGSIDSDDATLTVSAPDGNSSFEDEVLSLVNARRAAGATCGGTPYGSTSALGMNTKLRTAARLHSQDMAANNYFSHTSQDGRTFDQRIHAAGYSGSPLGENIAAGQPSPQSVVNAWMGSTGHCRNIMNPSYRSIGIGYAYSSAANYRHYWTMDLGGS